MIRGSDLALLRRQIFDVVRKDTAPRQKQYFSLMFEEFVPEQEIAREFGREDSAIYGSLRKLKNKILERKPFLTTPEALKYKGAGRMLKLLAVKCNRDNEAHNAAQYSYTNLFENIEDIVGTEGTDIQREVYRKFFVEGKSQSGIAAEVDRCQPNVFKTIYGNQDYEYNKHFGGIIAKVGKHLKKRNVPYCCHLINPYGSLLNFLFKR